MRFYIELSLLQCIQKISIVCKYYYSFTVEFIVLLFSTVLRLNCIFNILDSEQSDECIDFTIICGLFVYFLCLP